MFDLKELDIKIIRLSERKVRLDYNIDIICEEKVIESKLIKVRYKISEDGVYQMLYPKDNFVNQISNKLRVKKKFIHYGTIFTPHWSNYRPTTNKSIEIDGMMFENLIKSLYITDTTWFITWNRDQQLKNILNEKGID